MPNEIYGVYLGHSDHGIWWDHHIINLSVAALTKQVIPSSNKTPENFHGTLANWDNP